MAGAYFRSEDSDPTKKLTISKIVGTRRREREMLLGSRIVSKKI